jgi:hypothetical protein
MQSVIEVHLPETTYRKENIENKKVGKKWPCDKHSQKCTKQAHIDVRAVGSFDGVLDGLLLGFLVGVRVGLLVGPSLGSLLGLLLGFLVGVRVGL